MTKAIEDELGLPRLDDVLKELRDTASESSNLLPVEAIANALQGVNASSLAKQDPSGVDEHEAEADDIYTQAMQAHKDLFDLGFNIEPKHAGANAFTPSAKMLEIALKASQSKADRKMERIRIIMEKEIHDRDLNKDVEDGEIIEGSGQTLLANRNDLIDRIRKGEI